MYWNTDFLSEMNRLRREMEGLFSQYGRPAAGSTYPLLNVYENDDSFTVTAELPGMNREQVAITYSDGVLTLSGKREQPSTTGNMTALRRERAVGEFEKSLRIPTKVDHNAIFASFSNGILTVRLPKAEDAKPKTITIEAK
ncbi:MAG: Hsp20/alpha crystallin family protein [Chitinispirillaceae bacterium]|nr:Hsp20/alpha crystallin family protein [Chitinispirillaceae bacterium]